MDDLHRLYERVDKKILTAKGQPTIKRNHQRTNLRWFYSVCGCIVTTFLEVANV